MRAISTICLRLMCSRFKLTRIAPSADQHQDGRDCLRDDRRQRDARHVHVEHDHEEQVQHHVDDARQRQVDQRAARVADGAQHRGAKVVQHVDRHADEVDLHIERRQRKRFLRRIHPDQECLRHEEAEYRQHDAADQAGEDRRVHRVRHALVVVRAERPRDDDVCANRQPQKEVDDHVDQRARRADRRLCGDAVLGKLADHDDVRRVEQQLQNAREHQRQRKQENLGQERAARHVHLAMGSVKVHRRRPRFLSVLTRVL